MSSWILILIFYYGGNGISSTSTAFKSQGGCQAALKQISALTLLKTVYGVCVEDLPK